MRIVLAFALLALQAQAETGPSVYRWVDKDGVVHYADKPLTADAKPAELRPLQTFPAGSSAPLPDSLASAPAKPAPASVSISAPAQDETIRDNTGELTVNVAAALQNGQGLIYYLDGQAQNTTPTLSTAFLVKGLERGEHALSVAVVDAAGRELGRSDAVTVHVKPPTAKR